MCLSLRHNNVCLYFRVISATMKGISKAISRSTTPSRARSSSLHSLNSNATPGNGLDTGPSGAPTPGGIPLDAITPKVTRGRSISIKNRFKTNRANAGAGGGNKTVDPVTPYRGKDAVPPSSRWGAMATTPGTPVSLSGVVPNTDLSTESFRYIARSILRKHIL